MPDIFDLIDQLNQKISDLERYSINSIPTGAIIEYGVSTVPAGFLDCDGSDVSRTTYADLFSVVGVTYGHGDGVTTFTLPNSANRIIKT